MPLSQTPPACHRYIHKIILKYITDYAAAKRGLNLEVPKVHKSIVPQDQFFFVDNGFRVLIWLWDYRQAKKKKKECAPHEQARAKSNSTKSLVGRSFFWKKEVNRVLDFLSPEFGPKRLGMFPRLPPGQSTQKRSMPMWSFKPFASDVHSFTGAIPISFFNWSSS
jgi:hypothetical protein